MKATPKAVLDTRYQKSTSNTFPVRMRVTYRDHQKEKSIQKYFPTKFSMTEKDWKTMKGSRPGELKDTSLEINALEAKAAAIVDKMGTFSADSFKKKFDTSNAYTGAVSVAFDNYIKQLELNDQVGTAVVYKNAKSSLGKFKTGAQFHDFTVEALKQYERAMLKDENTKTTISMYLRSLRCLFNKAIADGDIPADIYPFGKKPLFDIKKGGRRKIALELSEVGSIYNLKTKNDQSLGKAKDFFIFMYLGNGINPKDMILLKYKNIVGDFISYYRQKTSETSSEAREVRIHLKPAMKAIIKKWGNKNEADNYIFPVLTPGLTAKQILFKKNDFVKKLNKGFKELAIAAGIKTKLSTYVPRHSFATILKRSGASMELISETLGHSDLKTTQNYLAGFEDATLINATDALTAFKTKKQAKVVNL